MRLTCGKLVAVLLCVMPMACHQRGSTDTLLDVKRIVNRSPLEVAAMLGKPDTTYVLQMMGKPVFCQFYKRTNVEIQFPESLATDIIVYGLHGLAFDQTALTAFNLDYGKQHPSDYRNGSFIRWSDFEPFSAISFYNVRKDSLNNIVDFTIFFKAKATHSAGPD